MAPPQRAWGSPAMRKFSMSYFAAQMPWRRPPLPSGQFCAVPMMMHWPSSSKKMEASMPGTSVSQWGSDQGPAGFFAVTMKLPLSPKLQLMR